MENNLFSAQEQRRNAIFFAGAFIALFSVSVGMAVYFWSLGGQLGGQVILPERNGNPPVGSEPGFIFPSNADCARKKTEEEARACRDYIIMAGALREDDFGSCLAILTPDLKNRCLVQAAVDSGNPDLCASINDSGSKQDCFERLAILKKDGAMCDFINGDSYVKKECKDRALAFIISGNGAKDDIGECEKIKTLEYSNLCFLTSYNTKFGGICNDVPETYRGNCVINQIIDSGPSKEDCERIDSVNYREFCLSVEKKGIVAASNFDTDGDGVSDGNEMFLNLDFKNPDTDGDGLKDGEEWFIYETDPLKGDSDGDGINDFEEMKR